MDSPDSNAGAAPALDAEDTLATLAEYEQLVASPPATLPHRDIRAFLTPLIVSGSSPDGAPNAAPRAATLYLRLLASCSLAYDDLTFSSALHVVRANRDAWTRLAARPLDLQNTSLAAHLSRAAADALSSPADAALAGSAATVLRRILRDAPHPLHPVLKAMFHTLGPALPTRNRTLVTDVLVDAAKVEREQHQRNTEQQQGDNDDDSDAPVEHNDGSDSDSESEIQREYPMETEEEDDDDAIPIAARPRAENNSKKNKKNRNTQGTGPSSSDENAAPNGNDQNSNSSSTTPPRHALLTLFYFACQHVPDRADNRTCMATIVHRVLVEAKLPVASVVVRCAVHSRISTRLVAIDLARRFVVEPACADDTPALLGVLERRVGDRVATARAKAIAGLCDAGSAGAEIERYATLVRGRLRDEKSSVRKAAVDFLGIAGGTVPVALLAERCADIVATIRLAAAAQLTTHARADTTEAAVSELTIHAVLPMLDDVDSRCRDACLRLVRAALIDGSSNVRVALLTALGGTDRVLARVGERAICALAKDGDVGVSALRTLCRNLPGASERAGAWGALAAVAAGGHERLVWDAVGGEQVLREANTGENVGALRVLVSHAPHLPEDRREQLCAQLEDTLHSTTCSAPAAVCEALAALRGPEAVGDDVLDWCASQVRDDAGTSDAVEHVLAVAGGVAEHLRLSATPPEQLLAFVQAVAGDAARNPRERAAALVTLGKLCLLECSTPSVGEALTRRFVSAFVHELDNAGSSASRANAVLVLADLCRKYTSVVEPFLPRIAGLLADGSSFVRHQVLCALLALLQQDYIKIRPGFVAFQVFKSVLDESVEVRRATRYALTTIVPQKNRTLLSTCFVEAVLALNSCPHSTTVQHFRDALRPDIPTGGAQHKARRDVVYSALLTGMSNEQRFRLLGRLRTDVLEPVAHERLALDQNGAPDVLLDALDLLVWPQINVFSRRRVGGSGGAVAEDEDTRGTQDEQSAAAAHAILKKIQLVEIRECIVPVLLELRAILETQRSPMLGALGKCLCSLLQPHRENISTFVADKTLRAEILRDMQPQQAQQQSQEEEEDSVPESGTAAESATMSGENGTADVAHGSTLA